MRSNKNILHGLIYVETDGLHIWIKEANFYSRNKTNMQVTYANYTNSADNINAKGDKLRLSFKGFIPHLIQQITKQDPRNEITVYISKKQALKLKEFLIKKVV